MNPYKTGLDKFLMIDAKSIDEMIDTLQEALDNLKAIKLAGMEQFAVTYVAGLDGCKIPKEI